MELQLFLSISVNLPMLINASSQIIRATKLLQYWHRRTWIMLQPYLLSPGSDTLFFSCQIAFRQWHMYLFCKVHDATGSSAHQTSKSTSQQPRQNGISSLSLWYQNMLMIYRNLQDLILLEHLMARRKAKAQLSLSILLDQLVSPSQYIKVVNLRLRTIQVVLGIELF